MDQKTALKILHSGENVFITGQAGSGKTYLLNKFINEARKKGKTVAVTATTGLAATHLNGTTIHSWSGMGVANSIAAVEAGAKRVDLASGGLGAGAGNTPLELFVAVANRMQIETGVDLFKVQDIAEELVVPMLQQPIRADRDAATLGYAGVYSSFLLFAKRAEAKYGVSAREILMELGRRGTVGGQEDMIEDLALTMSKAKELSA